MYIWYLFCLLTRLLFLLILHLYSSSFSSFSTCTFFFVTLLLLFFLAYPPPLLSSSAPSLPLLDHLPLPPLTPLPLFPSSSSPTPSLFLFSSRYSFCLPLFLSSPLLPSPFFLPFFFRCGESNLYGGGGSGVRDDGIRTC